MEKKAGDIFDLFYSSETYLELVKKGVSKGNALAATAQEANVPLAETIAIGDSDNDLSMILQAGLGVANEKRRGACEGCCGLHNGTKL